jgi:hypothetical protein
MPDPLSETSGKEIRAVVVGTHHEFQRHQDSSANREQVRAELDYRLRQIIVEQKIDLIAEEAGDDEAAWKELKPDDKIAAEFEQGLLEMMLKDRKKADEDKVPIETGGLFGDVTTVDAPVPTIARILADEYGAKHSDVDVDVRAEEGNAEAIAKRDVAMTEKILSVRGDAESVLVIVGESHRAGVVERLKNVGWTVESFHCPDA